MYFLLTCFQRRLCRGSFGSQGAFSGAVRQVITEVLAHHPGVHFLGPFAVTCHIWDKYSAFRYSPVSDTPLHQIIPYTRYFPASGTPLHSDTPRYQILVCTRYSPAPDAPCIRYSLHSDTPLRSSVGVDVTNVSSVCTISTKRFNGLGVRARRP